MKGNVQYENMKNMLDMSRKLFEGRQPSIKKFMLTEEEQKKDAIAITNDARFGQSVLQGQIDSFKQTVNAGAKFTKENALLSKRGVHFLFVKGLYPYKNKIEMSRKFFLTKSICMLYHYNNTQYIV